MIAPASRKDVMAIVIGLIAFLLVKILAIPSFFNPVWDELYWPLYLVFFAVLVTSVWLIRLFWTQLIVCGALLVLGFVVWFTYNEDYPFRQHIPYLSWVSAHAFLALLPAAVLIVFDRLGR